MTTEQQEVQPPRIRINWKQLANGKWQPDMTLEAVGLGEYPQDRMDADMAAMLRESDKLKAKLIARSATEAADGS